MKKVLSLFVISGVFLANLTLANLCDELRYGELYAEDGTFLGVLTNNSFDQLSIANQFGKYGSQFQLGSIFNQFGKYGSQFQKNSPRNEFSRTGPRIYKGNGYRRLTLNEFVQGGINTFDALTCFISPGDERLAPYWELYQGAGGANGYSLQGISNFPNMDGVGDILQKGDNAMNNEMYEEAIKYYEEALYVLKDAPGFGNTVIELNNAINKAKAIIAINDLKKEEEQKKADRERLTKMYEEAQKKNNEKDYKGAIRILEEVLSKEGTIERGTNYNLARENLKATKAVLSSQENLLKEIEAQQKSTKEAVEKEKTTETKTNVINNDGLKCDDPLVQYACLRAGCPNECREEFITPIKQELGAKAPLVETIADAVKKKDKATQEKFDNLIKIFIESKDNYTRNIGIYLQYLLQ